MGGLRWGSWMRGAVWRPGARGSCPSPCCVPCAGPKRALPSHPSTADRFQTQAFNKISESLANQKHHLQKHSAALRKTSKQFFFSNGFEERRPRAPGSGSALGLSFPLLASGAAF